MEEGPQRGYWGKGCQNGSKFKTVAFQKEGTEVTTDQYYNYYYFFFFTKESDLKILYSVTVIKCLQLKKITSYVQQKRIGKTNITKDITKTKQKPRGFKRQPLVYSA